ncbi:hypothetical protein [Nostoc sp. DSM 114159]
MFRYEAYPLVTTQLVSLPTLVYLCKHLCDGLAIAGNINAYNSSNLTFTNSTISGDNVNLTGNITINSGTSILKPGAIILKLVPQPSAIAGTIFAGSLAWLVKRKQVVFRKAKV